MASSFRRHEKTCFCHMLTTKTQISPRILASLCSWADWFESYLVKNPEDRFSRDEAQRQWSGTSCKQSGIKPWTLPFQQIIQVHVSVKSAAPFHGERGGSVVECRTPEREVRGSRPTAAVLCPWARHFTPRKYWLITQEAMAPSQYDWKIVDWDVKPQHNQPKHLFIFVFIFL